MPATDSNRQTTTSAELDAFIQDVGNAETLTQLWVRALGASEPGMVALNGRITLSLHS